VSDASRRIRFSEPDSNELVDEVGAADIKDSDTAVSTRESKFAEISLHFGVCIVKKAFLGVA
jgi:hypothetical protein